MTVPAVDSVDVTSQKVPGLVEVINFLIDGGGTVILTGVKGDLKVPYAGKITEWHVLLDVSGSIAIDIWKDSYANYPPVVGDSIVGAEKPTVSSATKAQDTSLASGAGWAFSAGDTFRFNVDSIATAARALLSLTVVRT